jgi:hypothetical protein
MWQQNTALDENVTTSAEGCRPQNGALRGCKNSLCQQAEGPSTGNAAAAAAAIMGHIHLCIFNRKPKFTSVQLGPSSMASSVCSAPDS